MLILSNVFYLLTCRQYSCRYSNTHIHVHAYSRHNVAILKTATQNVLLPWPGTLMPGTVISVISGIGVANSLRNRGINALVGVAISASLWPGRTGLVGPIQFNIPIYILYILYQLPWHVPLSKVWSLRTPHPSPCSRRWLIIRCFLGHLCRVLCTPQPGRGIVQRYDTRCIPSKVGLYAHIGGWSSIHVHN